MNPSSDRNLIAHRTAGGVTVWYVRIYHAGARKQFGSFPTKGHARAFRDKTKAEQRLGRFSPEQYHAGQEKASELFARYLLSIQHKKSAIEERHFSAWWSERFAGRLLASLTATDIERARVSLLHSGRYGKRSHATVNRYVAWLKHVLAIEVRQGRLLKNPALTIQKFRERAHLTVQIPPDTEPRMYAALGSQWTWARLAILLGLRQHEQFSLRWEWVDFENRLIVLPDTKAGEPQAVTLSEEACDILRGLDSWQRSAWVFPDPKNPASHLDGKQWYKNVFKVKLKAAGLRVGRPDGIVWHTLRHTFASRLAMLGATERDLMELGRWKSPDMPRRYTHLAPSHLRSMSERLSKIGRGLPHGTTAQPESSSQPIDKPATER